MQTQKEREIENKLASTSFWQLLMLAAALVIWAAVIIGLLNREQTAAWGWHFRMMKISNLSNQAVTFSTDLLFLPLNCLSHDGSCSSSREGGGKPCSLLFSHSTDSAAFDAEGKEESFSLLCSLFQVRLTF